MPDVRAILARDGYICHLCGLPIPVDPPDPSYALAGTIDHDTPRALGGTDDPSNLFAAHRVCNTRKGDTLTSSTEIIIWATEAGEINLVGPREPIPSGLAPQWRGVELPPLPVTAQELRSLWDWAIARADEVAREVVKADLPAPAVETRDPEEWRTAVRQAIEDAFVALFAPTLAARPESAFLVPLVGHKWDPHQLDWEGLALALGEGRLGAARVAVDLSRQIDLAAAAAYPASDFAKWVTASEGYRKARELERAGDVEGAIAGYEAMIRDGIEFDTPDVLAVMRLAILYRKAKLFDDEVRTLSYGIAAARAAHRRTSTTEWQARRVKAEAIQDRAARRRS